MKFRKQICLIFGMLLLAGPALANNTTSTVNTTTDSTVDSTSNNTNTNTNTNNNTTNYTGTNTNTNTNNNTNTTNYTGTNTNTNNNNNTTNYTGTSTNTNNNNNTTNYTGTSTNTNYNTNNNTINSTSNNTNTNNSTVNQTVNQTNTNNNTSNVTSNSTSNNNSNITNNTTTNNTNNNTNTNINQSNSTSDSNVTSNNRNENINRNETVQKIEQDIKSPPPSAIAPAIGGSYSQDLCTTGVGGAVQTQVFGISAGKTVRDENCERIKLSRGLYDMGMKVAAVSLMCQDARVFNAMLMAGTPCPFRGKIGNEALTAWQVQPDLAPEDALIESEKVSGTFKNKKGEWVDYRVHRKEDFCSVNPDEEICDDSIDLLKDK